MVRKIVRWVGIVLGGLIGLIVLAIVAVYAISSSRINKTYSVAPAPLTTAIAQGDIKRGEHIVAAIGACRDCHGANLGGSIMIDDPALGRIVAPNLTTGQGGIGATFTDIDWVRAIRHGVGPDGKGLKVMPSGGFYTFTDADLAGIIAYVKSQPPVDSDLPANDVRLLGRTLFVAGVLPLISAEGIPHDVARPTDVQPGVSVEYGRYLTTAGGCADCHGARLAGGTVPGSDAATPPAPNLTPGGELVGWTNTDFRRALREGKTPTGRQLSDAMPWKAMGQMSDEELDAVWAYLHSLPPLQYGQK